VVTELSLDALTNACRSLMVIPSTFRHRLLRTIEPLREDTYGPPLKAVDATLDVANLVSSLIQDSQMHAPVLDIDFPCALAPSSTPGHWHLYIDAAMPWHVYKQLLCAMREAGLLQDGFVNNALSARQSTVRPPWVRK